MELTSEQIRARDLDAKRITVIAGPGSGKSTTLKARIIADIERGANPASMAALTFTNAGARELKKKLAADSVTIGFIGTLHAYCLRMMPGIAVIDASTAQQLGVEILKNCGMKKLSYSQFEALKQSDQTHIAVKAYRKTLAQMQATDYDLILSDALTLITLDKLKPHARLYVDEYQDSAPIDADIYEALDPDFLFVVGDPDQSVFAFRGARMENIMEYAEANRPGLTFLENNFRCSFNIGYAANTLIRFNQKRIAKTMRCVEQKNQGIAYATEFTSDAGEAFGMISTIKVAIENGTPLEEIAVLCRYNSTREKWIQLLKTEGIPVDDAEPLPRDMQLVLAALQVMTRPNSPALIARWLCMNNDTLDFGSCAFELLQSACMSKAITPHVFKNLTPRTPEELAKRLSIIGLQGEAPRAAVAAMRMLETSSINDLILALLEGYAPKEHATGVTVTTFHGGKGREFDIVLMPSCDQDTSPGTKTGDALEEERRLFFVALTRARHAVYASYAASRPARYGKKIEAQRASQFLYESTLLK